MTAQLDGLLVVIPSIGARPEAAFDFLGHARTITQSMAAASERGESESRAPYPSTWGPAYAVRRPE